MNQDQFNILFRAGDAGLAWAAVQNAISQAGNATESQQITSLQQHVTDLNTLLTAKTSELTEHQRLVDDAYGQGKAIVDRMPEVPDDNSKAALSALLEAIKTPIVERKVAALQAQKDAIDQQIAKLTEPSDTPAQ